MEYEYSYKVTDLTEYENLVKSKYEFKDEYVEKRIIYRNRANKTIARISIINEQMYLDFKEDQVYDNGSITRNESKQIKVDNLDACEDILSFLHYEKDNTLLRTRSIYESENIKFEIDKYIEPNTVYVFSFEGDKNTCDTFNEQIKELNEKYMIKED